MLIHPLSREAQRSIQLDWEVTLATVAKGRVVVYRHQLEWMACVWRLDVVTQDPRAVFAVALGKGFSVRLKLAYFWVSLTACALIPTPVLGSGH